jgi:WG containing repeat
MKSSIFLFCLYLLIPTLILSCSQQDEIKKASNYSCPSLLEKKVEKEKKQLFTIIKARKWGFIDSNGKVVIKPQFNYVLDFSENRAAFKASNGKWGFIDSNGKVVIKPQFDKVEFFREGKAAILIDNKWGFVDSNGKIFIKPQFEEVRSFSEQRAAVRNRNWQWGLIDPNGIFIVKPSYAFVGDFSEGMATFVSKEKAGFIDSYGQTVFNFPYGVNSGDSFNEGRATVWERNPDFQGFVSWIAENAEDSNARGEKFWGVIDKQGREIVPVKWNGFNYISSFSECLAIVSSKDKQGVIDKSGAMVVEPKFDHISSFFEGLAAVTINQKEGFINTKGEMAIEPHFDNVDLFSEGFASVRVEKNGEWGVIDRSGNMVIEPQFPHSVRFKNGLAQVIINNQIGYIDRTGKFVWFPTQ